MKIIKPNSHINKINRGIKKSSYSSVPSQNQSFKSGTFIYKIGDEVKGQVSSILVKADEPIIDVFKKYYGGVSDRVIYKIGKIFDESSGKIKPIRFDMNTGLNEIREKKFFEALKENLIFPFVTVPKWFASWGLKKAQSVDTLNEIATDLYKKPKIRFPRKIHELDEKTDVIKGMYDKTKQLIDDFSKKNGIEPDELVQMLLKGDKSELGVKADEYFRENLYKVSNKFFDKHTGNFNTAYERPLNRIVSGLIPAAFLANDAYNLSVLCGDTKDVSTKEAKERRKQEITRVFTTAYIQLLMFGAFTKQVNTKSWFAPVVSGLTVLFSETTSRKNLGKPIFFLSKEKAKEYNKKQKEKELLSQNAPDSSTFKGKIDLLKYNLNNKFNKSQKVENTPSGNNAVLQTNSNVESTSVVNKEKGTNVLENRLNSINSSFKAQVEQKTDVKNNKEEKKPQKTLITMDTLKKGLAILTVGGFVLSFIKNGSHTKNSPIMKAIKDFGADFKKKVYNPLAFKDFQFKTSKYDGIMAKLKNLHFEQVADGHNYMKTKYAEELSNGVFKVYKYKLPNEKVGGVVDTVVETLKKVDGFDDSTVDLIKTTVKSVVKKNSLKIEEKAFSHVGDEIVESLGKGKANIGNIENKELSKLFADAISQHAEKEALQVETKLKPFLDILTEPFKFVVFIGGMPYRLVSSAIKAAFSPVTKEIAKAEASGKALTKFQKAVKTTFKEVFGDKVPKKAKNNQSILINALESMDKNSKQYFKYTKLLEDAQKRKAPKSEIERLVKKQAKYEEYFMKHVGSSIEKSFNGVTQSSNKNTDLAMLSKLSSSLVTSAFLVADNYNMVMIKSDGEDKEDAKEKAYERIIQRLSALFYQTMFINLFNSTFRSTYNSSLKGMASVVAPNTVTTEVVTRASIGMPIRRKSYEELVALEEKNENRKGLAGKYFKFMRLLTGKKPLKERMPKDKMKAQVKNVAEKPVTKPSGSTNLLEMHLATKK